MVVTAVRQGGAEAAKPMRKREEKGLIWARGMDGIRDLA